MRDASVVLVAEGRDGTVVGFVQLYSIFSSVLAVRMCLLSALFVIPPARRRSVGTRLLHAVAEMARAAGAIRFELATVVANVPAQKLYEVLGWKRDEEFYVYGFLLVSERAGNVYE